MPAVNPDNYQVDVSLLNMETNEYYVFYVEKLQGRILFFPAKQKLEKIVNDVKVSVELNYVGSKILELLAHNAGNIVTRDEILGVAWEGRVVSSNSLNQSISMLRESLELESGQESIIVTVPRWGYKINAEVVSKDSFVNEDAPSVEETAPALAVGSSELEKPSELNVVGESVVRSETLPAIDNKARRRSKRYSRFWPIPLVGALILNVVYEFSPFFFDDGRPTISSGLDGSGKVKYVVGDGYSEETMRSDLKALVERVLKLSVSNEDKIIFNKMHEYYEVVCIDPNNFPVFIIFHGSQINNLTDEQILGCLK